MKSGRSSIFAFAVLALAAARVDAVTLLVQPNKLYLAGQRGMVIEQEITISSLESSDVPLKLTMEAFMLNPDGRPLHRPSAAVSEWASLTMTEAVVHRGERLTLPLRLTVPADGDGTSWCALLIETPTELLPNGSRIRSRVAVPIFVTVAGTEQPRAAFEDVKAVSSSPEEIVVAIGIRNTGNTVLRAPIAVAIEDHSVEVATVDIPEFVILPGTVRLVPVRVVGRFEDVSRLSATVFYRVGQKVMTSSSPVATRANTS